MQNYQQQAQGFQRPGSTASFAGHPPPPPPPPYNGYQTASPTTTSQWAPPAQNTTSGQGQWNHAQQSQQPPQGNWGQQNVGGGQAAGGYNPGTYGAMPGGYGQAHQPDQPPPPPPKPAGYPGAMQQQTQHGSQNWGQQPQQGFQTQQQNTGFAQHGQQGDFDQQGAQGGFQHGGFANQGTQQQTYNNTAPPPASQTPGGSYFPPAPGRPGSIYGADQVGTYSTPPQAPGQPLPSSVLGPNEQQPAYIPPSLTGQGVQSYMPANTNPMPGVYVPPPPDIPAWQQASHAPLQGGNKKFRYTKPTADPSFQAQGYQSTQAAPQQGQYGQQAMQPSQPPMQQPPQQQQYTQSAPQEQLQHQPQQQQQQQHHHQHNQSAGQDQFQHQPQQQHPHPQHHGSMQAGQFVQPSQPLQNQFSHPSQQQDQFQQQQVLNQPAPPPPPYASAPQGQHTQQTAQQYPPQNDQWQPTPPADQSYGQQQPGVPSYGTQQQPMQQQQQWQAGHQPQGSIANQQYPQGQDQSIQAPKPLGRTGSNPPDFINHPSPTSQPVSPVQGRNSMSFGSGHHQTGLGRTSSISSIALGAVREQQTQPTTKMSSPAPSVSQQAPPPQPAKGSSTAFSALGSGGPSDWEHFGHIDEEVDDEEMFAKKDEPAQLDSVELPASQPEPPSAIGDWPTPETRDAQPAPLDVGMQRRDTFQPTPPPAQLGGTPASEQRVQYQPTPPPPRTAGTPIVQQQSQYQPTPPIQMSHPPPAQQSFVMGDAVVVSQTTPAPTQPPQQGFAMGDGGWPSSKQGTPAQSQPQHAPPPGQQAIVMDDGGWAPPKQSTPAQVQQQVPPPAQQGFVMDDGSWATQATQRQQTPMQARQHTPAQQQLPAPPQTSSGFVMGDGAWGAAQQAPAQAPGAWAAQAPNPNQNQFAELKAKDEAYERLRADVDRERADAEKQKVELRAEIDKLKADVETAKGHAAGQRSVLNEQIESMKVLVEQAKNNAEALHREKDTTIERLKEDAEGKEDTIKERDAAIADLRRQLEAEKTKVPPEPPKPTPADLIPDIDPWYAGSLERFIAMLRGEAGEPQVQDKIKVFTGFLKTESAIRGLDYYSAPPPESARTSTRETGAPVHAFAQESSLPTRSKDSSSPTRLRDSSNRPDMHVLVPRSVSLSSDAAEPAQFSPGGRPILQRKPTLKSKDSEASQQSFSLSSGVESAPNQSTTILTPTSSNDDDLDKTPIQSPPEELPQPQYKAYVPPAAAATVAPSSSSVEPTHRQSMSFATPPSIAASQPTTKGKHDEIFFGEPQPASKPTSRPTTSADSLSDVPVPAPHSFTPQPPAAAAAPKKAVVPEKDPLEALDGLLPRQVAPAQPNSHLEDIRKQLKAFPSDFAYINDLTVKWEKAAALMRKKNDIARQKRQEESEARTDELFNDHEISYADIGDIEDEFKEKERISKAQEDRDEYKTYVEEVFDKVYDGLQSEIKSLMDLYIETESLLHSSASGIEVLSNNSEAPTTQACLELLKDLHIAIEERHDKVVNAVTERDKRYKKTEVQPLYAAGNIAKMKNVEKHFDNAEKQAVLRAKHEKAERIGELVHVVEEVTVAAVSREQGEADKILAAMRNLSADTQDGKPAILERAKGTLHAITASSKTLLTLFNALEVELNTAVLEAEISQARAGNGAADAAKVQDLEREMADGERKLKEEFARRIGVLEQDGGEVDRLVKEKGGVVVLSEDEEKKRRMKAALDEAKRRNGEL